MTPEEKFNEIWSGLTVKIDLKEFRDSVFFFKGSSCYFHLILNTGNLWCSFNLVWEIFDREYGMSYKEIQNFIKTMAEKHFNKKEVLPLVEPPYGTSILEEHFNEIEVVPMSYPDFNYRDEEQHFLTKNYG